MAQTLLMKLCTANFIICVRIISLYSLLYYSLFIRGFRKNLIEAYTMQTEVLLFFVDVSENGFHDFRRYFEQPSSL